MPSDVEIYGYGTLANVICCLCSLGGAVILPCASKHHGAYNVIMPIFMGLAIGTLLSDAALHLVPEAFGLHSHGGDHQANNDTHHNKVVDHHQKDGIVEPYAMYGMIILIGCYLFYILEIIMSSAQEKAAQSYNALDTIGNGMSPVGEEKHSGSFHKMEEMTCDANFTITNCVAKWPGSVHDARMFRDSHLCTNFENGNYNGLLLGDSAYPCRQFLMTPYVNADTPSKTRFNNALCRTRVLIEQTYGILKRRFSCLHSGLRLSPQKSANVIVACVILHNLGIKRGDIINVETNNEQLEQEGDNLGIGNVNDGVGMRELIRSTCFS